jgi:hypothetical protein
MRCVKILYSQAGHIWKIWRKNIACWIPTATSTHSKHVILIAFPLPQWLQERASILRCRYTVLLINVRVFSWSSRGHNVGLEKPGFETQQGKWFFFYLTHTDQISGSLSHLFNEYWASSSVGGGRRGGGREGRRQENNWVVNFTTQLYLVPKLRTIVTTVLLSLHAFVARKMNQFPLL